MKSLNKRPIVLFDIDYTLFDTAFFKQSGHLEHKIYKEVMQALESLSKIATLGIFSKGEYGFQKIKLEKTGLAKFFKTENVFVFDDKELNLAEVLRKYLNRKVFLVDDKLSILFLAKGHLPSIFTIWVKRGPYADQLRKIDGFTPDRAVLDLREIADLVGV